MPICRRAQRIGAEAEKEEEAKLGHSLRDVLTCAYYLEEGIKKLILFRISQVECFYAFQRNQIQYHSFK